MKACIFVSVIFIAGCPLGPDDGMETGDLSGRSQEKVGTAQVAIIKADDFGAGKDSLMSSRWEDFVQYIRERGIKSSLGVIGIGFLAGNSVFYDTVKVLSKSGIFEFWNHGYEHIINQLDSCGNIYSEFRGTDFRYQLSHLRATQELVRMNARVILRGFGAPGNLTDDVTTKLMDLKPYKLEYWFSRDTATVNVFVFRFTVEVEERAGDPNYSLFLESYSPEDPYLILEIHPKIWTENDYSEFDRIVGFLLEQGVRFILPSEYLGLSQRFFPSSTIEQGVALSGVW